MKLANDIMHLGVEKNNDDAKQICYRSSNWWDPAVDILSNEHKVHQLKGRKRTPRDYK